MFSGIKAPEEAGVWGFDVLERKRCGLSGETAVARNRQAGRKETGNAGATLPHQHSGMHRQSYATEGLRPGFGRIL
ncbi:MAG: hypothetical protein AVO34_12395 [Firmicutes bacterium ML8_F2]|nr:MAG: hypothetical protein AVO34_12395 [Firmicutes bacterium ML8_F2]